MNIYSDAFKHICATCRHLSPIETGREFEMIADTEFTEFKCNVLGWKKREFYLMAPPDAIEKQKPQRCEFWEPWDSEI